MSYTDTQFSDCKFFRSFYNRENNGTLCKVPLVGNPQNETDFKQFTFLAVIVKNVNLEQYSRKYSR